MESRETTLYLWDVANTLFVENWNPVKTGYANYNDYLATRGVDSTDPRTYEEGNKEVLTNGWMVDLSVAHGFRDILSWTKHNETFSTGNREQMDWRAEYLNPLVGYDVRSYFQSFNSTFDYDETNIKTKEMLSDYMKRKYSEGYRTIVYTDDVKRNCHAFIDAAKDVKAAYPDWTYRVYCLGEGPDSNEYVQVQSLLDVLKSERNLTSKE